MFICCGASKCKTANPGYYQKWKMISVVISGTNTTRILHLITLYYFKYVHHSILLNKGWIRIVKHMTQICQLVTGKSYFLSSKIQTRFQHIKDEKLSLVNICFTWISLQLWHFEEKTLAKMPLANIVQLSTLQFSSYAMSCYSCAPRHHTTHCVECRRK